jgi:hypothetical protein
VSQVITIASLAGVLDGPPTERPLAPTSNRRRDMSKPAAFAFICVACFLTSPVTTDLGRMVRSRGRRDCEPGGLGIGYFQREEISYPAN